MMAAPVLIAVLLFGVASLASGSAESSTLLNVIQVYRHGERSPGSFYPTDPYQDISYWGISTGQLTNVGKRQHHALGQYTRRRYWDFLPLKYSKEVFLVQSTNMDRTFMSAASQLSGLFPPVGDQLWNPLILWQPIPIFPTDPAVMSPLDTCSAFYPELYNVIQNDPYFVSLNQQYAELFEYIGNNTGSSVTTVMDAYSIYDTLYIEDRQNFVLPEWTKSVYPEPLKTFGNIMFNAFSYNDKLKLLTTGPFLNQIIEQFDSYLKDPSSVKKYRQFSAHDLNISAILNALGAFNPILAPNFASTIYIEFRERNGANFINFYYKNYGDAEPITVAGCDFDCEWNTFKTLISNRTLTPSEWKEKCNA